MDNALLTEDVLSKYFFVSGVQKRDQYGEQIIIPMAVFHFFAVLVSIWILTHFVNSRMSNF